MCRAAREVRRESPGRKVRAGGSHLSTDLRAADFSLHVACKRDVAVPGLPIAPTGVLQAAAASVRADDVLHGAELQGLPVSHTSGV